MKPKYQVITFGCQMNEHDSEILAGMLEAMGYEHSAEPERCAAIVVNTCCVRESAENRIMGYIRNLKKLKQEKSGLVIAVGGCMAQAPGMGEKIRRAAPYVDIIFGTHNLYRLPHLIHAAVNGDPVGVEIEEDEGEIKEDLPVKRQGRLKAQVNIMYGCNNYCTYCIVPYVRGRERSRQPDAIKNEVLSLGRDGYKEIMLLGQNVNSYGRDFPFSFDFADLLLFLNGVSGIERIRYMTSHPRDFSKKLIEAIAQCDQVCEHFHLPIQAGSNRILSAMNRGYSREKYLSLLEEIRKTFPHCSITTDFIVGFPGETEQDFQDTVHLVREARFDTAYTFLYSPRSGTPAAKMPDQIPLTVKKERLQALMEEQNSISLGINERLVGTTEEILVEGLSKTNQQMMHGRTRTNKIVNFPGGNSRPGDLINVKIIGAKTWHLEGQTM